jgi:hypothetical protein
MCIGEATFRAPAAGKPEGRHHKSALAAPRGLATTEPSCFRNVRVSSRSQNDFRRGVAEPATRWSGQRQNGDVKARVRHNDGKTSIYLVVRPRNIDRTLLGQDGIARPLRHARIRCEGSCGVLRQAPSEKEARGLAARKPRCGHALQKMSARRQRTLQESRYRRK